MIASELREWTVEKFEHLRLNKKAYNELSAIADRIDEKYEGIRLFCSRLEEAAADHEDVTLFDVDYIPLPLDADGEYIHIGDMMWQKDHITKRSCKAIMGSEYVMLDGIQGAVYAKKLTHYYKPTVEKLLEEMYDALDDARIPNGSEKRTYKEIIAEYAKKLQLREETE